MLDTAAEMFENMSEMMRKLKKLSYEKNMKVFREKYGHYIDEMLAACDGSEEKEAAAKEASSAFTASVQKTYAKCGKLIKKERIEGRTQADLNFFMIYYVFPAILLSESESKDLLADTLCKQWNAAFGQGIGYTTYDKIHDNFREKIFGII